MQRSVGSSKTVISGAIVIIILFCIFIFVLWEIGLFEFTGSDASSKIVSASIALVGALLGSVVSIIGLFLKNSMEQRNSDLANEAEERLKLDTAIRAVGLLGTSTGNLSPRIQRAGALFALTSLNRHELAMALTLELLENDEIDAFSAVSILSRVMESGESVLQEKAVEAFHKNFEKFLNSDGTSNIPNCIFNWGGNLSEYSRVWGFEAIARMLAFRPVADWKIGDAYAHLGVLGLAWTSEHEPSIKLSMGTVLNTILPAFPGIDILHHPLKRIDLKSIRDELSSAPVTLIYYPELVKDLDVWVSKEDGLSIEKYLNPDVDSNLRND